jgi:hypothetical protein
MREIPQLVSQNGRFLIGKNAQKRVDSGQNQRFSQKNLEKRAFFAVFFRCFFARKIKYLRGGRKWVVFDMGWSNRGNKIETKRVPTPWRVTWSRKIDGPPPSI